MQTNIRNNKKTGFTYTELIITIIILGVIASIALPRYLNSIEKTKSAEGIQLLSTLREAQETYKFEHGSYATSLSSLEIDFTKPATNFEVPIVPNPAPASLPAVIASVRRNTGTYRLCVDTDGNLNCSGSICPKLGNNWIGVACSAP